MIKAGFLVAGLKGLYFLKAMHKKCNVAFVASYRDKNTLDDSREDIISLCRNNLYAFVERDEIDGGILNGADIVFVVGWQYLIGHAHDKLVIFHDSLLPRYRGFAPTVCALINGDKEIGVTALKPAELADRGSVYGQSKVKIRYPIKIKDAFNIINGCYIDVATEIISKAEKGSLNAVPQDESKATYSIWRDESDYIVNWNWPSDKIARFVDAVGWPYHGAKTTYRGSEIIIDDAEPANDLEFEDRHPGKIWLIKNGAPEVVCVKGLVRILSARYPGGDKVVFATLRSRLGVPLRQTP